MQERDILIRLLVGSLRNLGLGEDQRYTDRLKKELKEVDAQSEHEYYIGLVKKFQKENLIFPVNENNTLVDYLLGLAPNFDIEKPFGFQQGEWPDIDVDIIKEVRDWIKKEWAIERYGQEYVCEIATYNTLGIKSAILDMTNVYGISKDEIQAITVKIEDKDDEGKLLEWDKALEMYPEFKAYCEKYPELAATAKAMQGRKKAGGVHAGGLIISSKRIDGFVPLEVRSVKKDLPHGVVCSAWTEGLATQDLQPVGLVKFDLLVISNLKQIAYACKLIKERHGVKTINAIPGGWDWSDTNYLNDEKSIAMANAADLRCVFQFDSDGIRKLVKKGGVTSFNDLVAYTSLYRPSGLTTGMADRYWKRKTGDEPYSIHPVLESILGKTYGVMIYQEQVMDILREVGKIPDMHTEKVRKAISKKKVEDFIKYKQMFLDNGQRVLHANRDFLEKLWEQIEAFAGYGFNASHACAYSYISSRLLWLKAHYPIEFYTAILMCEDKEDKFKDYRLDAKNHGVDVCRVHINKSKENFHIDGNGIYFGFQKIKEIGEAVAKRIVDGQPYKDLPDFLARFGTDKSAVVALIALGAFEGEHDRLTLRKFHEYYKTKIAKRRASQLRNEIAIAKKQEELIELLLTEITKDDPDFEVMSNYTEEASQKWAERFSNTIRETHYKYKGQDRTREVTLLKQLQDLAGRRESSICNFSQKEKDAEENPLSIDQFNADSIKLDDDEIEMLTDEIELDGTKGYPLAERAYYGFQWIHRLETCLDYKGLTIDKFLEEAETNPNAGCIEVFIDSIRRMTTKGERPVDYWKVGLEDANGKKMTMHIWKDDYVRFQDYLKKGTMMKIRVKPPGGGYNTLTFESVPKKDRNKLGPAEDDCRIVVMKPPQSEKKSVDLTEFAFDVKGL
jgi:DNA polymerase III alpha subunit